MPSLPLLKHLAQSGVASRRKAEKLIRDGKVTVNGEVVTEPATRVSPEVSIMVEGKPLRQEARQTFVMHKPPGVISTAKDPHGRRIVTDLVPSQSRLYPVGRLDYESEGLLLLTNDGELANRLTHPRYEVPKTYLVAIREPIADEDVRKLEAGIELDDGRTLPAQVTIKSDSQLEITIREGRNRQVRRMMEAVGHQVAQLSRIAFGPVTLGELAPGDYRELTPAEIADLEDVRKS